MEPIKECGEFLGFQLLKNDTPLYIKKSELKTFRATEYPEFAVIIIGGIEYTTNNSFNELVDILIKRNEKFIELKVNKENAIDDLLTSWSRLPVEVLPLRTMDEIGVRKQGDKD